MLDLRSNVTARAPMKLFSPRKLFFAIVPLSIVSSGLLSGCGASLTSAVADPQPGDEIHGVVHGGQFPIQNAQIYLMAANTSTLKGASLSLLSAAGSNTKEDTSGNYYVTTAADGSFNLSGDYTCPAGLTSQVYVLATGGNPGQNPATNNSAAIMIALLGPCPPGGTLAGTVPYIVVNEVTTVVAAYSVAAYAADYAHIGGPGAMGLANAFATAKNLVALSSGQAYTTTPGGNGTAPQTKIYALANSLAACVNSSQNGTTIAGNCATLFSYTPNSSGVAPVDVFDAALNLAHSPGLTSTNTSLYSLGSKFAAFAAAGSAPTDWSISIKFTSPNTLYPARPAIDASGDVWIPNTGGTSLTELSPSGAVLSGNSGFTGGGLENPVAVAIDATNSIVWVANYGSANVSRFSLSGAGSTTTYATSNGSSYSATMDGSIPVFAGSNAVTVYTGFTASPPTRATDSLTAYNTATTVDPNGHIWAAQYVANSISELGSGYTTSTSYTGGGLNEPTDLVSDTSGDIWVANAGVSKISEFQSNGTAVGTGYTGGGLLLSYAVRIDSAGNLFVGNSNASISEFATGTGSASVGTVLSGSNGFQTPSTANYKAGSLVLGIAPATGIVGMGIDQSGNLWAPCLDGSIYEFVGLAAPVAH
jgi:streptogramin lyase